ncbi:MAG: hypothetical protein WAM60_22405 [Candidatus Promineifilaceae bacterium]
MKEQKITRLVSIIGLFLLLSIWLWSTFSAAAEPPKTEGEPDQYLPIVFRPLPTPTPTPTPVPVNVIVNGNFEAGQVGWQQYSSNGWQLILQQNYLPVPPRSGNWAVWLGGDYNEDSVLTQDVTVPVSYTILTYWLWIASEDDCGSDIGGVVINQAEAVDSYWLCSGNSTGGWLRRDVNLASYAGQTVEIAFAAFTDDSLNSNMFLDDISLGLLSNAPTALETPAVSMETANKAQVGLDALPVTTDATSAAPLRALLYEALGGSSE